LNTIRKELRIIAAKMGCKIMFKRCVDEAEVDLYKYIIYLDKDLNNNKLISLFCHELAHIISKCAGKFPIYHNDIYGSNFFRTAYRAEVFVDKIGKKICSILYPKVKYKGFYDGSKYSKKWFKDNYLTHIKEVKELASKLPEKEESK